ncbi:toll-like receptor 13 [Oppia nitens]|uniref:toll-like receptor 13 n=1 Tax=Oppia nitens TaxID=1686743 RepID=UPI0023D9FA36|nr:toll-like receptor 13 [Oppia nitens]
MKVYIVIYILTVTTISCIIGSSSSSSSLCPDPIELYPCQCSGNESTNGIEITCAGDGIGRHELIQIGRHLRPMSVQIRKLNIRSTRVNRIDNHTFADGFYEEIRFINNRYLGHIEALAFGKSTTVRNLQIVWSEKLDERLFGFIGQLNILDTLAITGTAIRQIPKNALQAPLRRLQLSHNQLNRLVSQTFSQLPKLRELDLSYNPITMIDDHSLNIVGNNMSKVIKLNNLRYNGTTFGRYFLPQYTNHKVLIQMENNGELKTLVESAWKPFLEERDHRVTFTNTTYRCKCDDLWLAERPVSGQVFGLTCKSVCLSIGVLCVDKSIADVTAAELSCGRKSASSSKSNK